MSDLQINISMDSDAYIEDPLYELRCAFEHIIDKLGEIDYDRSVITFPLRDTNGNSVGRVRIDEDDPYRPTVEQARGSSQAVFRVPTDVVWD